MDSVVIDLEADTFLLTRSENWMIDPPVNDRKGNLSMESDCTFARRYAPVFLRVGGDGEAAGSTFFLDLGDASGRAVKVRADGWSVVDRPGSSLSSPRRISAPSRAEPQRLDRTAPPVCQSHREPFSTRRSSG